MAESMRLQKWLAEAGICSRREGEKWITAGRVKVNGTVITQLGTKVGNRDKVVVDGRSVTRTREPLTILALHKPPGVLCTRKDPENRRNTFDLLSNTPMRATAAAPQTPPSARLISVGRLDYNSEGLILFTNHGDVAHGLMHPSHQIARTYRVRVRGRIDAPLLAKLKAGLTLEDGPTGPLDIQLDHVPGANSWLTLTLKEGRNRMVRRIFGAVDMEVSRLLRVAYGTVTLGALPRGAWRALQPKEMASLLQPLKGIAIPLITPLEKQPGKSRASLSDHTPDDRITRTKTSPGRSRNHTKNSAERTRTPRSKTHSTSNTNTAHHPSNTKKSPNNGMAGHTTNPRRSRAKSGHTHKTQ